MLEREMMICHRAGKTSGCAICPEAKPHEPQPNMLPSGITVEKTFCAGDKMLAQVRLVKAPKGRSYASENDKDPGTC